VAAPDGVELLDARWAAGLHARAAQAPEAPGLTGVVAMAVPDAPAGELRVSVRYDDGRPGPAEPADGEPVVILTIPVTEAVAIFTGRCEPSVGFMRGRVKTAGDPGALLRWLRAASGPQWLQWLAASPGAPSPGA